MAEQLILKGTLEGHVSFFLIFLLYITETMSTNATAAAAAAVAVAVHDAPPLPLSSPSTPLPLPLPLPLLLLPTVVVGGDDDGDEYITISNWRHSKTKSTWLGLELRRRTT